MNAVVACMSDNIVSPTQRYRSQIGGETEPIHAGA